jgi:predicted outer membrane repeat protein
MVHPSGVYTIRKCRLTGLEPVQVVRERNSVPKHNLAFWIKPSKYFAGTLLATVSECIFESSRFLLPNITSDDETIANNHVIQISSTIQDRVSMKARIRITNCTFLGCSAVDIRMKSYPPQVTVEISDCMIDGQNTEGSLNQQIMYKLSASGVKLVLSSGTRDARTCGSCDSVPRVSITNNVFTHMASMEASGVNLKYIDSKPDLVCSCLWVRLENNTFAENWGLKYGSVFHAVYDTDSDDTRLKATKLVNKQQSKIELFGNTFHSNHAELTPCYTLAAYQLAHNSVKIGTRVNFDTDSCSAGDPGIGVIHIEGFNHSIPEFVLENNRIVDNKASGLSLTDAMVKILGNNAISANLSPFGAGVLLKGRSSHLILTNSTNLTISDNQALLSGGGIYISEDSVLLALHDSPCFFQLDTDEIVNLTEYHSNSIVSIQNNSARSLSESIFNPNLETCTLTASNASRMKFDIFQQIFNISTNSLGENGVSSQPHRICLCDHNGNENCSLSEQPVHILYPGQNMILYLKVLGDMNLVLPAVLSVFMSSAIIGENNGTSLYHNSQWPTYSLHTQYLSKSKCNRVSFNLFNSRTRQGDYHVYLSVPTTDNTHASWRKIYLTTHLRVKLLSDCPAGFIKNVTTHTCECHQFLTTFGITCSLDTMAFIVPPRVWIGSSKLSNNNNNNNNSNNSTDESSHLGVLVSKICPAAYCKLLSESARIKMPEASKTLCNENRSGVMCGQCVQGTSVTMWSNTCSKCNGRGLLSVLLYLIAGPLLIAFICAFNWTISTRSINGLLFYVNIMNINSDLLYPRVPLAHKLLAFFSLEFGISMCLYNGLTEFGKTMIYFAFPTYLLVLVALLIFISQRINMHRINKLIGPRITPVLATVVYFSYTMLIKRVAASLLSSKVCDTLTETCYRVWRFDGSLSYFASPEHIILACVALLFTAIVLIPITVTATIGDLFRRFIKKRWYMNFLDTIHGSFRFRFGFWIGLRLIARVLVLTLRIFTKEYIVLPTTAAIALSFMTLQWITKPFRHLRMESFTHKRLEKYALAEKRDRNIANGLDCAFLLNLTVLYICLSYLPDKADILVTISVIVMVFKTVAIFVYHTFEYSPFGPIITKYISKCFRKYKKYKNTKNQISLPATSPVELELPLILRVSDCTDDESSTGDSDCSTQSNTQHDMADGISKVPE